MMGAGARREAWLDRAYQESLVPVMIATEQDGQLG
jgi:hypothetical protein